MFSIHLIDQGSSPNIIEKSCLSPISLIKIYDPEALNSSTHKHNPIYRSFSESESENAHRQQYESSTNSNNDDDLTISNIQITPSTFMKMCPALLVQIEQNSCVEHLHDENEVRQTAKHIEGGKKEISTFGSIYFLSILNLCSN